MGATMASEWMGMCPSFGNCSVADRRDRLGAAEAPDRRCPECGRELVTVQVAVAPESGGRRRPRLVLYGILAAALVLTAAALAVSRSPRSIDAMEAASGAGEARRLTIAGSNTIGIRLGPAWAAGFLKKMGYASVAERRRGPDDVIVEGRRANDGATYAIAVSAHGTATGFDALAAKGVDLAMASRAITDAEAGKIAPGEDMRAPFHEHVVALDGVAVIVNPANPVSELTTTQIADLFAGRVSSWKGVGGADAPVTVYARDDNSGTFDTFRSLILNPTRAELAKTARRFEDSGELANAVAADMGAVGFVGLPHVGQTKTLSVSDAGGAATLPSRFTIATEDYPLSRRLYLYNAGPLSPAAADFLTYALSAEGQTLVRECGFVGMNIESMATPPNAGSATPEYAAVTTGAARLSTNLRFRSGSEDLDSRALPDMDRIVDHLAAAGGPAELILLGFTDNSGSAAAAKTVSRARAVTVADALGRRGVRAVRVLGMGAVPAIAGNKTVEGREKNRRVEIWIKAVK